MGHIINAKSTRIGWTTIWHDSWYTEFMYYSEYLHSIYKIRFYLIYIFTRKYLDKNAIFYSHFEIIKLYKNINIEIYLYDGKLESDYEDLKFEFFLEHFNLAINKDPETRIPKYLYTPLKFIIIWKYLENFKMKEYWDSEHIGELAEILRNYNISELLYYFKELKKLKIIPIYNKKNFNLRMLLFICLFLHSKIFISKWSVFKKTRRNTTLRRFYMFIVTIIYTDMYIEPFCFYLNYILSCITYFYKIKINFFLTNNNSVNAKFLSRYIARKLKQNYPMKQLLNPIRKELILVIRMSSLSIKSYINKIKNIYLNKEKIITKINIFNSLINIIKNYYSSFLLYLFLKNKTLFSLDLLLIYIWLNKYIKKYKYLVKISLKYFLRKSIYLCFFEQNFNIKYGKYLFLPKITKIYLNKNKSIIISFIDFLFEYFYIHKLSMINIISKNYLIQINLNSFRSCNINFNRYLRFFYLNNKFKFINKSNINHLKSRDKSKYKINNNLIGYKMQLRGRFKRKQRAGSYWFSKGSVPLNSINAYIDYAYFTIPLINSAITVKVWLYKSNHIDNNFFYKIN